LIKYINKYKDTRYFFQIL